MRIEMDSPDCKVFHLNKIFTPMELWSKRWYSLARTPNWTFGLLAYIAYKVTARILERPRPPGCSPAQLWGSWQPEDKMRADQVLWIPLLLSIKCVRHTGVWLHCIDSRNFIKPFNRRKFSMGKLGCTSNPTQAYCYSKKNIFQPF